MMLETILTILQSLVLPALVPLAHRALQVYLWRRRAEDVREYNVMLAAAQTDEVRRVIEANPPPAPPDFGAVKTIFILLLSGAALLGALAKAPLLVAAAHALLPATPVSMGNTGCGAVPRPTSSPVGFAAPEMQAAAAGGSCSRDSDCGSGCSCKSGSCKCAAQKPLVRPGPAPRRLASMDGSLCADCLALPWSAEPVDVLYGRRRDD